MDNYYSDPRVRAALGGKWYESIDVARMQATLYASDEGDEAEPVVVRLKFEVCPTCNGRGSHVNPSIDCNGISGEDFADDPEFFEDYRQGVYDVDCYECHGERVVPSVDRDRNSAAVLAAVDAAIDDENDSAAWAAAERRAGA